MESPSDGELELAIVAAVTGGALDVAKVLAGVFDKHRKARTPSDVVALHRSSRLSPRSCMGALVREQGGAIGTSARRLLRSLGNCGARLDRVIVVGGLASPRECPIASSKEMRLGLPNDVRLLVIPCVDERLLQSCVLGDVRFLGLFS